ncbi:MAG TPA: polysaccharide biosynthesis/export family protein [Verrucomicrobiae bacterium]|nr:polysaccharide biosynthesis/export family protein [Verrucomicrobiae bacterium]
MTIKVAGSILVACLASCLAQVPLQAAAAAPPGDVVQALSVQPSKDGTTITLVTSVPVPRFTCVMDKSDPRQVVIDFPAAMSRLKKRYALGDPLVREAQVEKAPGPGVALRIRLTLGEGALAAVELGGQGVNLRFLAVAAAPIPTAAPAAAPAPIETAAASSAYLVGAGDKLDITVLGHTDLDRVLEVRGDGTIGFPLIGDVPVAGRGLSQISSEMTRALGRDFIVNPQISVNIKEYGSQWVTVIGEVNKPGRQLLRQRMSLIELLAEAGGFTAYANRKQIEILRTEGPDLRRKLAVNLRAIEEGKQKDIPLKVGDVVIVPRRTF